MKMKINSEDFRVWEGHEVDLTALFNLPRSFSTVEEPAASLASAG
jgi:hypothetical protein